MYNGILRRPRFTADADQPSAEQLERRRQSDLLFLYLIRRVSRRELILLAKGAPAWRICAIRRQLRLRFEEKL